MASPHHLPVLQPSHRLPRRRVLLIGAAAAGTLACRADFDIGFGVMPQLPSDDGGDGQSPLPGDDSGVQNPEDTGVVTPQDAANNPGDDATSPGQDSAVTDPHDASTPPEDASVPPPQDDAAVPPPDAPPACTPGPGTMVGTTAQFAQGTWTELQSPSVVIGHDTNGLYAYTSVCTHQGCICDPPDSTGVMTCQCHGSMFDGNGAVLQGPARRALAHYALSVCNGSVYVDTSSTVAATTRTSV